MVKMGAMIVIGFIIVTMAAGMYTYIQYQTNYITSVAGETVTVGQLVFVFSFEGTVDGSE